MLGVLRSESLEQPRCAGHHPAGAGIDRVERPQRVQIDPAANLLGEPVLVGTQVALELGAVLGPRLGLAEARKLQVRADSDRLQELGQQHDQLGVGLRLGRSDHLGADLPELAKAALLRRLGAEEARQVPELHGLRQLVHPVLDVGAAHRRRPLRPQRERAPGAVRERVHLLLHDVSGLPHAAREQLGRLERRGLDPAVAGSLEDPLGVGFEHLAARSFLRKHVERAARSLNPHQLAASSRKNGLVARSCPSVVIPMCPG